MDNIFVKDLKKPREENNESKILKQNTVKQTKSLAPDTDPEDEDLNEGID